ncbi:MAG: DUF2029 domain-containing protein [Planctomycetes bacterium]|nr:DUF2029 domain-containing protein [Planctomycetota bacterium]
MIRYPWLSAIAVILLVTAIATAVNLKAGRLQYDEGEVHVYVLGAERMRSGAEIYRPDDIKPFTYPPGMALMFMPLTLLPHDAVRPLWYGANALLLVWAIALVRRLVRQQDAAIPGDRRAQWAFWLLTVVLSVRHVAAVFSNQSNDLPGFVLVLLGMTGMASRRDFAGGLAIGLAAASKATPILFLPFLLLLRRFRASAGTMVGTLLGSLAPDVLFPRTDHRYWVESWFSTFVAGINPADGGNTAAVGNAWKAWNILNQNLASMFYRLFTEVEPIADHTFDISLWHMDRGALGLLTLTAQLVVATVLIYAAWRARHLDAPRQALGIGSLLVCGMVLLSPMSSKSHFCVLVAPIALCVHDFVFRRRDRLVLVCLMVLFVGALTSKGVFGRRRGNQLLAHGAVTWCALAALVGTTRVLVRSAARPALGGSTGS